MSIWVTTMRRDCLLGGMHVGLYQCQEGQQRGTPDCIIKPCFVLLHLELVERQNVKPGAKGH